MRHETKNDARWYDEHKTVHTRTIEDYLVAADCDKLQMPRLPASHDHIPSLAQERSASRFAMLSLFLLSASTLSSFEALYDTLSWLKGF